MNDTFFRSCGVCWVLFALLAIGCDSANAPSVADKSTESAGSQPSEDNGSAANPPTTVWPLPKFRGVRLHPTPSCLEKLTSTDQALFIRLPKPPQRLSKSSTRMSMSRLANREPAADSNGSTPAKPTSRMRHGRSRKPNYKPARKTKSALLKSPLPTTA